LFGCGGPISCVINEGLVSQGELRALVDGGTPMVVDEPELILTLLQVFEIEVAVAISRNFLDISFLDETADRLLRRLPSELNDYRLPQVGNSLLGIC
jgi:hypothetical protein